MLNRHKESTELKEPEQPKISYNNNENEQTTYRNQPPEPPHREPRQESEPPQPPQPDIADTLINIELAHIGRITTRTNPYITPKQTAERHNVERTFLKLLSKRYTDTETHKNLAIYFMVYKEVTLFVIFAMVLKNDKPLLAKIHSRLKVRLSLGLPSKVIAHHNQYWRKLSEKFNESYIQTHDLATTLDYVFWSVLPENLKGEGFADLTGNGYLKQIFDYAREAIAQEYKNIARWKLYVSAKSLLNTPDWKSISETREMEIYQ